MRWIPILTTASLLWLTLADHGRGDEPRDFRAGAAAIDITPEKLPISLNGGMSDNVATKVHDPLHARCLVLDDGRTRIAIVVCDSCMIPRDLMDAAKEQAAERTGIPTRHMLISATHAHSCPTVTGVFQSEPDENYRQFLVGRIVEAIAAADGRREPAEIGWGRAEEPHHVFNRRWYMKPGTVNPDPFGGTGDAVRMNPGQGNDANDRPAGPVDPEVCVLSVRSRDGRPIALLANYSLHYVGGVTGGTVSADYFGAFADRIALKLSATRQEPPFVGIMSNGTSGNINNVDYSLSSPARKEPFEQIGVVAEAVASKAFEAYQGIEHHDWVSLAMAETEINLGVRLPSDDDLARAEEILAVEQPPYKTRPAIYARETRLLNEYPETVRIKLQALRIGELGIVSSPCETFVEMGLAIKEQSPLPSTFVIELANGYNGYLPTPEHHALGGYETWRARSSYLATDAEPRIRQTLLELLRKVAETD